MTKPTFELPQSSLSELEKIIEGYYILDANVSLDDISSLTGIGRTHLSPNHAFLKTIGIIHGTNQKSATPLGKDLGGAIHHKLPEEVQQYWMQVVDNNEFLSKFLATIKIKKGMTAAELSSHILFVAKTADNKTARTGANAIIDILLKAKRIHDVDGKFEYSDTIPSGSTNGENDRRLDKLTENDVIDQEKPKRLPHGESSEQTGFPNLHINIQIHISADSSPDQIDQIFASMAKHLKKLGSLSND